MHFGKLQKAIIAKLPNAKLYEQFFDFLAKLSGVVQARTSGAVEPGNQASSWHTWNAHPTNMRRNTERREVFDKKNQDDSTFHSKTEIIREPK